jgi:hypothetical protein
MSATSQQTTKGLRVSVAEACRRLKSGQPMLVLDVRSPKAWDSSRVKIPGAIHLSNSAPEIDPSWPRDRFTLTYCT